jgi:pimeloyl-ACP methyl ester carboxylesterase
MQSSIHKRPLQSLTIATPSGPLELLACLPDMAMKQEAILCVHGAHCAAACFMALLPLLASAGYPSYAVSLRGHGGSWQPSTFAFHALSNIDSYVADVIAANDFISSERPEMALILVGHSMGGGVLQRALGVWTAVAPLRRKPAGLVLLASAPLSGGGMEVARRWQAAEAALAEAQAQDRPPVHAGSQGWLHWFCSFFTFNVNTGVHTPAQVRNKFFSAETPEGTVTSWLRHSKGRLESIRVSIGHFWPFADAAAVLDAIDGELRPRGRKMLCVSGERDVLIAKEASVETFDSYHAVCQGQEEVLRTELAGSAHHIMLDIAHERCADIVSRWIQEEDISDAQMAS